MKNVKILSLFVAVLFVSNVSFAAIYDHFNNGSLDSEWQVNLTNTNSWTYAESGSNLICTGIGRIDNNIGSDVLLTRSFSAPDNFEVKAKLSWDNLGTDSVRNWFDVRTFSGSTLVAWGGYSDNWISHTGQKVARFLYSDYMHYDSGMDTLPYSGSAEITIKRTNGNISILWNNDVMLTGYSNLAIDKIGLCFHSLEYYPGATLGIMSFDYVTAVPEPTTMLLLAAGMAFFRKRN